MGTENDDNERVRLMRSRGTIELGDQMWDRVGIGTTAHHGRTSDDVATRLVAGRA